MSGLCRRDNKSVGCSGFGQLKPPAWNARTGTELKLCPHGDGRLAALARHGLVLVGPTGGLDDEIRDAIAGANLGDRIVLAGPHAGEDLVRFYAAADLFVFPTFYEGWTSPPLEAMACGVPVVASNASSVPETVGDAAVLVDPNDPADMARGMCRAVEDAALRDSLRAKGFARAAMFTWERTVRSTVDLYLRLGAG